MDIGQDINRSSCLVRNLNCCFDCRPTVDDFKVDVDDEKVLSCCSYSQRNSEGDTYCNCCECDSEKNYHCCCICFACCGKSTTIYQCACCGTCECCLNSPGREEQNIIYSYPKTDPCKNNCAIIGGFLCFKLNVVWRVLTFPWQDSMNCCDVICARIAAGEHPGQAEPTFGFFVTPRPMLHNRQAVISSQPRANSETRPLITGRK